MSILNNCNFFLLQYKDNNIYNQIDIINKSKNLYAFETFILLIYKKYYK